MDPGVSAFPEAQGLRELGRGVASWNPDGPHREKTSKKDASETLFQNVNREIFFRNIDNFSFFQVIIHSGI
jgi:hypothetical protein